MKKILILITSLFIFSCNKPVAKYEIAVPASDGIHEIYYHTDSIDYLIDGCISFVSIGDSTSSIYCGEYEVTKSLGSW